MTDDDLKQKIKQEEEEVYGEVSGYSESDEIDESFEEFVGHEPKKGENIADEVKESEDARRGKTIPHR